MPQTVPTKDLRAVISIFIILWHDNSVRMEHLIRLLNIVHVKSDGNSLGDQRTLETDVHDPIRSTVDNSVRRKHVTEMVLLIPTEIVSAMQVGGPVLMDIVVLLLIYALIAAKWKTLTSLHAITPRREL